MVNVSALMGRLSFLLRSVAPVRFPNASAARSYSVYPAYYIKPIFKKEEQEALVQTGQDQEIVHVPIYPALSYNTSSEFHDHEISKFINYIMRKGKKTLARKLLEESFVNVKRMQLQRYHSALPESRNEIELDPLKIFYRAVQNVTPVMELKKMKRGGVTYQVPVPILEARQRFLAMNWLIGAAKDKRKQLHLPETLAKELVDAAHNHGRVVKKKQDLHKQCEANRAYAHYRWA